MTIIIPSHLYAWGKTGHDIAGELAYHFLDNVTKEKLNAYLGATPIEGASTWMDEVRRDHSYDYMKPWHYVDYEASTEYMANHNENLVNELNKTITELEHKDNLNADKIKTDLEIVIHLVEDMHQPLHVGYPEDKGGNTIKVNYMGKTQNLHHVWDDGIIKTQDIGYEKCIAVYKTMRPAEVVQLKTGSVEQWLKESRSLLPDVYDFKDSIIDEAYIDKNTPIIEKQLVVAGIRLAAVLEKVLK